MGSLRWMTPLLVLLLCYGGASGQGNCTGPTVNDVIAADPQTTYTAAWASQTSSNIILDVRAINITILVASDTILTNGVGQAFSQISASDAAVLAMYGVLEGYLTQENFTSVPSVNSILGMVKDEDYTIKMFNDPDTGKLKFTGRPIDGIGNVLSVTEACNGVVYVTDKIIRPAERSTQILEDFDVVYSVNSIYFNGANCNISLPDEVAALPNTAPWVSAWEDNGMTAPLSNIWLASTVLVPQEGVTAESSTTAALMYNMLRGEFCPEELVAAGSMNSMLGEVTKTDLPLRFEKDADGNVIVIGAVNSAKVINKTIGCNSVVLMTDQPLVPPATVGSMVVPKDLPTKPIRHITCNPIVYLDDGGPASPADSPGVSPSKNPADNGDGGGSNSNDSSNSSALAIGLGVGLGCAAVALVAAAFIIRSRRRHKNSNSSKTLNALGDSIKGDTRSGNGNGNGTYDFTGTGTGSYGSVPATDVSASLIAFSTGTLAVASIDHFTARIDAPLSNGSVVASSLGPRTASGTMGSKTHHIPTSKVSDINAAQLSRLGSSTEPGSLDLWEIDADDVEISIDERGEPIKLGKGSFGAVYRGTLRGVQPTAIKVLNESVGNEAEAAFQREAAILKHVNRDRNVVQLYGTSKLPDGKLLLLTELMEGGDLRRALNNSDATEALAWNKAGKGIALDIARGLTALHAVNVVHRDLKSKNVLLTSRLDAKIGDVGIAAIQTQAGYLTASAGQVIGTLAWSAPELLLGKRCSEKVDIFSFGIVLWELATGKVPQRGFAHSPAPSPRCPVELIHLMEECTDEDPLKRPSAKQVYDKILRIPPVSEA